MAPPKTMQSEEEIGHIARQARIPVMTGLGEDIDGMAGATALCPSIDLRSQLLAVATDRSEQPNSLCGAAAIKPRQDVNLGHACCLQGAIERSQAVHLLMATDPSRNKATDAVSVLRMR